MPEAPVLFPYRVRPGQASILREVAYLGRRGGPLLINAPTGSGKTVATLAPLIEHAEAAGHRILYLVRTHSQEVQVLRETQAMSRRLDRPILAIGLAGRARRCFLLENVNDVKVATAEEHGKLCADRKRATEQAMKGTAPVAPPVELPENGEIDLTDLDGCPYYARVLQSDLEGLVDRSPDEAGAPARVRGVRPRGEPVRLRALEAPRPSGPPRYRAVRVLLPSPHPPLALPVDGLRAGRGRPRDRRGPQPPEPPARPGDGLVAAGVRAPRPVGAGRPWGLPAPGRAERHPVLRDRERCRRGAGPGPRPRGRCGPASRGVRGRAPDGGRGEPPTGSTRGWEPSRRGERI